MILKLDSNEEAKKEIRNLLYFIHVRTVDWEFKSLLSKIFNSTKQNIYSISIEMRELYLIRAWYFKLLTQEDFQNFLKVNTKSTFIENIFHLIFNYENTLIDNKIKIQNG